MPREIVIRQRGPATRLIPGIAGNKRALERLGERDVRRIIRREVVAEIPHPIEHRERPVAGDPEPTKRVQDFPAAAFIQLRQNRRSRLSLASPDPLEWQPPGMRCDQLVN